eukprot:768331-Hanusia_phi.AAC.1
MLLTRIHTPQGATSPAEFYLHHNIHILIRLSRETNLRQEEVAIVVGVELGYLHAPSSAFTTKRQGNLHVSGLFSQLQRLPLHASRPDCREAGVRKERSEIVEC